MDILHGLNEGQKKAVLAIQGPVLIIAGPGSGKTKVLTHRVAHLIAKNIPPQNILAITFTNKAASEMKERIFKLLGKQNTQSSPTIGTFHAICAQFLRKEISCINRKSNFVIFDGRDTLALIKKIFKNLALPTDQFKPQAFLAAISSAKNEMQDAKYFKQLADNYYSEKVGEVYERYEQELILQNGLDFDDLIVLSVKILTNFPNILLKYQNRWQYILVDEYQDVNQAQYTLVKLLAGKNRNIFVIGDSDQSIYTWRGADFRNILNFEKDWPEAEVITLDQSYRSSKNILSAAHIIISKNQARHEKNLWTQNAEGHPIVIFENANEREESRRIAQEIKILQDTHKVPLREIAVLYRTNAQSRAIEEAFLSHDIPYRIVGTLKFYARAEIKDILAYLRLISNPADLTSQERIINVPPRGIGPTAQKQLPKKTTPAVDKFFALMDDLRNQANTLSLNRLILMIIRKTKFDEYLNDGTEEGKMRQENLHELLTVSLKYDELPPKMAIESFLEEVALIQEHDDIEQGKDVVTLMTLHTAKGLEFDTVFIAGMEEGILPHGRSAYDATELEEERRLCYVGITRAKNRAYLSYAKLRTIFGSTQANLPSRFLYDLPPQLLDFRGSIHD